MNGLRREVHSELGESIFSWGVNMQQEICVDGGGGGGGVCVCVCVCMYGGGGGGGGFLIHVFLYKEVHF